MNEVQIVDLRRMYLDHLLRFQQKYHRVLPFSEMMVDRWEKARLLGFGENTSIYDSAIVYGDVHVGEQSWIGPQVILDGAAAPVRIGAWCSISAAVHIYTHDSVAWAISGGKAAYSSAPVNIGDNVYVGPMTVIAKGVTIGNGCIIGAHSFVNSDIPAHSAAWGSPARVVGRVVMHENGAGYDIESLNDSETLNPQETPCAE